MGKVAWSQTVGKSWNSSSGKGQRAKGLNEVAD